MGPTPQDPFISIVKLLWLTIVQILAHMSAMCTLMAMKGVNMMIVVGRVGLEPTTKGL